MNILIFSLKIWEKKWHYTQQNIVNISCDTIKVLVESIGSETLDTSRTNILANISPRAGEIKEKHKQMGLHQIKKFLHG